MSDVLVLFEIAIAVAVSAAAVAASIGFAERHSIVDVPDGARKLQTRPIPRLGGVAVALSFTVVVCGATVVTANVALLPAVLGVLVPAIAVAVMGYVDDVRGLRPSTRLALQSLFALVAFALGTRVALTHVVVVDAALTVLFVVVVVNGVNLLDNSDGLAASTVLVSAAAATVIAMVVGQSVVALMAGALAGVCVGFLLHNWFPARVYLGDAGAYLLGFLVATLVIRLRPEQVGPLAGVVIALLLVALPIVDTAFVVVRRLSARTHPFTAGRDHLSHVLQGRGRSVPAAVLILQVLPGVAAVAALLVSVTVMG